MAENGDKPLSSEDRIRMAREAFEKSPEPDESAAPTPDDVMDAVPEQPDSGPTAEESRADTAGAEAPWQPSPVTEPTAAESMPEPDVETWGPPDTPMPPPEPPQRPWYLRRWVRFAGIAAVALGSVLYGALTEVQRDESGEIVESGTIGVFEARVGDCLLEPLGDENISEFEAVPCGDPHHLEVYALVDHPGGSSAGYPGESSLVDWGSEQCYERFEGYVGASWEASLDLDYFLVYPIEEAWSDGERRVSCSVVAFVEGDELTGSMSGVGSTAGEDHLGFIDVFDLGRGDCVDFGLGDDEIQELASKSCEGLHDAEVYSLPIHPAVPTAPFPGEDSILEVGETMCGEELSEFAGSSIEASDDLTFFLLWPTEESWDFGDREYVCFVWTASGKQIVGSVGPTS